MDFSGQQANDMFKGTKVGRIYLTTHRMIFNNKKTSDPLQSVSFPFVALSNVDVEQPVFGANFIKGVVKAQENGNWSGSASFKLLFKAGGAIDFAQSMLKAVQMARRNYQNDLPPPYQPPSGSWYAAPPPAYTPTPNGYYGWMPSTQAFPNQPPADSVFMHDSPPPYPGINPMAPPQNNNYGGVAFGGQQPYSGVPAAGFQQPNPMMGGGGQQPQYPQQPGFNPGYNPGYNPGAFGGPGFSNGPPSAPAGGGGWANVPQQQGSAAAGGPASSKSREFN